MVDSGTTRSGDASKSTAWMRCVHQWRSCFGPVLKCRDCGATTIQSFGGESKAIYGPVTQQDADAIRGL